VKHLQVAGGHQPHGEHAHGLLRVVGAVGQGQPERGEELRAAEELVGARPRTHRHQHAQDQALHDEPDDEFILRPEFRRGIAQLREFNLTYDLLLFPKHLRVACPLVQEFPEQPFVLDHIAKPEVASGRLAPWSELLRELAKFPNVSCKLSGMVTEAQWGQWRREDFHRYLDVVVNTFGLGRLMIGSDWPVCTLSGSYEATMGIVIEYLRQFSSEERAGVLGGNCARIYRIGDQTSTTHGRGQEK